MPRFCEPRSAAFAGHPRCGAARLLDQSLDTGREPSVPARPQVLQDKIRRDQSGRAEDLHLEIGEAVAIGVAADEAGASTLKYQTYNDPAAPEKLGPPEKVKAWLPASVVLASMPLRSNLSSPWTKSATMSRLPPTGVEFAGDIPVEVIEPCAAIEIILAFASVQPVVVGIADLPVAPALAVHDVMAAVALENVIGFVADHRVSAAAADEIFDADQHVLAKPGRSRARPSSRFICVVWVSDNPS